MKRRPCVSCGRPRFHDTFEACGHCRAARFSRRFPARDAFTFSCGRCDRKLGSAHALEVHDLRMHPRRLSHEART